MKNEVENQLFKYPDIVPLTSPPKGNQSQMKKNKKSDQVFPPLQGVSLISLSPVEKLLMSLDRFTNLSFSISVGFLFTFVISKRYLLKAMQEWLKANLCKIT